MSKLLERTCNHWSSDSVRLINTPSPTARAIYYYVQEVGHFRASAPYSVERANLPSFLLIYTLQGRGILNCRGDSLELLPGSCLFLNCVEHHRYYTPPDTDWEFLWLHFNGSCSLGYYEEFQRGGSAVVTPPEGERFQETLRAILRLNQQPALRTEAVCSLHIVDLLTQLLSAVPAAAAEQPPPYLRAIWQQLERTFADDISLDALARQYGISKYYLSRQFKQFSGVTLMDYLTRMRLNYAKELLRFSTMPVGEIAFTCGFHDVSHFIKVFRQREDGITPLVYRRQWQQ